MFIPSQPLAATTSSARRAAREPAAATTHAAWAAQREALRGLHADALHEAVPPVLLAAARQAGRAQFMFEDGGGQRITLYLGAVDGVERQQETAFSLGSGPVPSFYWVDRGLGYALAGELPRERLLALAQAAHQQLQDVTR